MSDVSHLSLLRRREPRRLQVLRPVRQHRCSPLAAIAEERKIVTTLFCDLVGFTAMSEAADPEDVDALLRALPRARHAR